MMTIAQAQPGIAELKDYRNREYAYTEALLSASVEAQRYEAANARG